MDKILEPCRRASGSFRAHFASKEAAESLRSGPKELADLSGRCSAPLPQMFSLASLLA
jgi:hypothetical protein